MVADRAAQKLLRGTLQFRAGEMLSPVRPNPLNTWSLTMVPPPVGAEQKSSPAVPCRGRGTQR
jgi:hypothetical protein